MRYEPTTAIIQKLVDRILRNGKHAVCAEMRLSEAYIQDLIDRKVPMNKFVAYKLGYKPVLRWTRLTNTEEE